MSLLLMFAGLAYGVYMFLAFVLCVAAPDEAEEQLQKWLDSLTWEERRAYHREKRRLRRMGARYRRLLRERRRETDRLLQELYDRDGLDDDIRETMRTGRRYVPLWLTEDLLWDTAGVIVGERHGYRPAWRLWEEYREVREEPERGHQVPAVTPLRRWREKPKKPEWA